MKKAYILIAIIFCLASVLIFHKYITGHTPSDLSKIKSFDISKIIYSENDPFDAGEITILKTWDFINNSDAINLLLNKEVIGDLEPLHQNITDNAYDTYYIKIAYTTGSVEEWILKLDNKFQKDGIAENKANRNRYVLISTEYVKKIGKLLE